MWVVGGPVPTVYWFVFLEHTIMAEQGCDDGRDGATYANKIATLNSGV